MTVLLIAALALATTGAIWAVLAVRRLRRLETTLRAASGSGRGASAEDAARALAAATDRATSAAAAADAHSKRLEAALDASEVGIIGVDAAGRVLFASSAAQQFISARHGAVVAEVRVASLVPRAIATGEEIEETVEVFAPRRSHLGLRVVPTSAGEDDELAAVVFVSDLSARVRLDAMRRDFVANVGHELKTPLGALSVLAESLDQVDESESRERLTMRIRAQTERMTRLVDDLLDLSLVETGDLARAPVAIGDVVAEALERVGDLAADRDVGLKSELGDSGALVDGDRRQLVTAVANLLDNAVKYSPTGRGASVVIRTRGDGRSVVIEVEDEGVGIAAPHLDRIFERFYRVDRARSGGGGTGLGLSIVRHVAAGHGGMVEVRSRLGEGSVFRIVLPRRS